MGGNQTNKGTADEDRELVMHVVEFKDENPGKKFPTGIASLMFAVQSYWPSLAKGVDDAGPIGTDTFCSEKNDEGGGGNFFETWETVRFRWPGSSKEKELNTLGGLSQHLPSLYKQQHELRFSLLEAFASHCEIPVGLFLLYAKIVSIEMENLRNKKPDMESKKDLADFIKACRDALNLAEYQVKTASNNDPVFNHYFPTKKGRRPRGKRKAGKFMAKAVNLRDWRNAFKASGARFNPQIKKNPLKG